MQKLLQLCPWGLKPINDCCEGVSPRCFSSHSKQPPPRLKWNSASICVWSLRTLDRNACQEPGRGYKAWILLLCPFSLVTTVTRNSARLWSQRGREEITCLGLGCLCNEEEAAQLAQLHGRWCGDGWGSCCFWQGLLSPLASFLCRSRKPGFSWLVHGQSGLPWGQPSLSAVPGNGLFCLQLVLKRPASHLGSMKYNPEPFLG